MPKNTSEASWRTLSAKIYEGVADRTFLERMTAALNDGMGMGVTQWSGVNRATMSASGTAWSRPSPPSLYAEYERYYAVHDPRIEAALQNFGKFLPCWRLVDPEKFEKSIIVNEWSDRRDIDTRWTSVCIWGVDDDNLGLLAFCRPRKDGPIQLDELHIANRLRSHVRRAAQLHFLFSETPLRARAFDDAWGSPIRPVFLMGKGRRLLAANEAGHSLLAMGDVFQTQWGELTAREPRLLAALDNALAAAHRFDLDITPRQIFLGWPRYGGMTALKAEVMALPGVAAETGLGEQAQAVIMCREVPRRRIA
jgi:hypothetical protein